MAQKKTPFVMKTPIRVALEAAGYPVTGSVGIIRMPGWSVDRAPRKRRKRRG